MSLVDFQSYSEIKKNREVEAKIRERILSRAKDRYEKQLREEEEAEKRGEKRWMLPSIEDKIKGHKKKKKEKKKKSKKKKKLKKETSSSSESENENNSEVWIEKSPISQQNAVIKRDEWMELPSLFKSQTREQMKIVDGSSRTLQKLLERKKKEEVNKPGSHSRELNPYYKDGGSGLPDAQPSPAASEKSSSFCEASWLKKALERAKTQACEEGRPLEEIAKERWGSLETFKKLLEDAEGRGSSEKSKLVSRKRSTSRDRSKDNERRKRRSRSTSREDDRSRYRRSRSRDTTRSSSRDRNKNRGRDRNRSRSRDRNRSRSRDRNRTSSRNRSSSSSTERNRNRDANKSKNRERSRSRSKGRRIAHREERERNDESNQSRRKYSKKNRSKSSSSSSSCSSREMPSRDLKGREKTSKPLMLKPCSDDESTHVIPSEGHRNLYSRGESSATRITTSSWRKKVTPISVPSQSKHSSSSSSSESDDSDESEKVADSSVVNHEQTKEDDPVSEPVAILTDKEMNQLGAKLTKAELLGNETLVKKLKSKLSAARSARENPARGQAGEKSEEREEEVVVLTRTDRKGFTRPIASSEEVKGESRKKKRKAANMFDKDGQRVSYFADDFKVDLHSMFEKEKTTSAADEIAALEKLSCTNTEKLSDDFDVDDMFISKVAPRESAEKEREREKQKAIFEHQRVQKSLESCHSCVDSKLMKKHLIVALGTKCYVSVPHHKSLTEGHCLITPLHHVMCSTQADEDLCAEIMTFRQALVRMFSANDEDCIFFESAKGFHQAPHMVIHCIPLPRETGELAPIYFKKAIMESDEEWAQNKKLIDLKGRDVRKAIPKGLPYFFVDFGLTPGFAHVIENEALFPSNFAQEIIGGMLDSDFSLYRKPKPENFDIQRKKVLKFAEMFKPFDPT